MRNGWKQVVQNQNRFRVATALKAASTTLNSSLPPLPCSEELLKQLAEQMQGLVIPAAKQYYRCMLCFAVSSA